MLRQVLYRAGHLTRINAALAAIRRLLGPAAHSVRAAHSLIGMISNSNATDRRVKQCRLRLVAGQELNRKGTVVNRSADSISISLGRTINASADDLFAAWTDPMVMRCWLAPEAFGDTAVEVEADARVGGRYLITVVDPSFVLFTEGEYRELVPSEKVVMTRSCGELLSRYRDEPTLVTVNIRALGPRLSELVLTHSAVPTEDETGLREGWANCLDKLQALYASDGKIARPRDHPAN
jgi:uncharacterized protein YndB with AHSA1/START domain